MSDGCGVSSLKTLKFDFIKLMESTPLELFLSPSDLSICFPSSRHTPKHFNDIRNNSDMLLKFQQQESPLEKLAEPRWAGFVTSFRLMSTMKESVEQLLSLNEEKILNNIFDFILDDAVSGWGTEGEWVGHRGGVVMCGVY